MPRINLIGYYDTANCAKLKVYFLNFGLFIYSFNFFNLLISYFMHKRFKMSSTNMDIIRYMICQ